MGRLKSEGLCQDGVRQRLVQSRSARTRSRWARYRESQAPCSDVNCPCASHVQPSRRARIESLGVRFNTAGRLQPFRRADLVFDRLAFPASGHAGIIVHGDLKAISRFSSPRHPYRSGFRAGTVLPARRQTPASAAISSGSPIRVTPEFSTNRRSAAARSIPCSFIIDSSRTFKRSVRTAPGLTAFTWTPSRIPASARAFVNDSNPAFTAPPAANSAPGVLPPAPEMKSTDRQLFFK